MSYLSLSDYGLIGNSTSSALVSRLGSIDWCCLPYLDSPSHFGALLDELQGGRFQIMPQGEFRSEQRYVQRTNVLETAFETPFGRAVLTDWMPVESGRDSAPLVCRSLEVLEGKVNWLLTCTPRFHYGAHQAQAESFRGGILFRGDHPEDFVHLSSDIPLEISANGSSVVARFTLEAGKKAGFSWAWGRRDKSPSFSDPQPTVAYWRDWAHRCSPTGCVFGGPWHDAVVRSGLVLKLLTTAYAGSIAEAVTTSLPAAREGSWTWDYRYAWIREGALAIQALANLGYSAESSAFFDWIRTIVERDGAEGLQPVYTLDGGKFLPERELEFLSGYRGSRPVRVGNQSSRQFELDTYGHVMLAAAEHYRLFHELPKTLWPKLVEIADYVCQAWRRPDHGPWDSRSKPEHFVVSKLMCWAALDRAGFLARELGFPPPARWDNEKAILHRTICDQGFDRTKGAFVRSFGDRELDSGNLLIPLLGFLPFEDPRIQGTLDAIQSELSDGVLIHRDRSSEGVPSAPGAHLWSSFLFVSCLALAGRIEEASDRLAELCSYATALGLFSEQAHPGTGEPLGNFPSASVHLGLVNAALYVGMARGRQIPMTHLVGLEEARVQAERAKRA